MGPPDLSPSQSRGDRGKRDYMRRFLTYYKRIIQGGIGYYQMRPLMGLT